MLRAEVGTEGLSARLATAGVTLVSIGFGFAALFSSPINGDEGYLLVTLREWGARGGLYDRVYSQYGPFYYSLFGSPARIGGFEWTFASGRVVNLLLWVSAAFLLGVGVRVITQRWQLGLAAQVVAFAALSSLRWEPMHPGALLCASSAALVATIAWLRPRRKATADLIAGGLVAAMLLTKINVGVFAAVAVLFAICEASPHRWVRLTGRVALIGLGPVLLLSADRTGWRWSWAALVAVSAALVAATSALHDNRHAPAWRSVLLGALPVGMISVGVLLTTGTSAGALVRGATLRPLDHARLVDVPVHIPPIWIVATVLPAIGWWVARRNQWTRRELVSSSVLRIVAGFLLLITTLGSDDLLMVFNPEGRRFAVLPLLALLLVPPPQGFRDGSEVLSRRFLAAFAVVASLHAYPVPGSQVSWSLFLASVSAVVIVGDGVRDASALLAVRGRWLYLLAAATCVLGVLTVPGGNGVETPGSQFAAWIENYRTQHDAGIRGAEGVRVPADQAGSVSEIVPTLRKGCDTFVPLGAPLSWYLLADMPTPSGFNQPAWSQYLDRDEQRATVAGLHARRRVCVLVGASTGSLRGDRLAIGPAIHHGPIQRYLSELRWEALGGTGFLTIMRAVRSASG